MQKLLIKFLFISATEKGISENSNLIFFHIKINDISNI